MKKKNTGEINLFARVVDFIVLGATFYASCLILTSGGEGNLSYQALVYASVILLAIRIGRSLLGKVLKSHSRVVRLMLYNATGLIAGAIVLSLLSVVVPGLIGPIVSIVVASVIAFFVLGTLSPLLMKDRHTGLR